MTLRRSLLCAGYGGTDSHVARAEAADPRERDYYTDRGRDKPRDAAKEALEGVKETLHGMKETITGVKEVRAEEDNTGMVSYASGGLQLTLRLSHGGQSVTRTRRQRFRACSDVHRSLGIMSTSLCEAL